MCGPSHAMRIRAHVQTLYGLILARKLLERISTSNWIYDKTFRCGARSWSDLLLPSTDHVSGLTWRHPTQELPRWPSETIGSTDFGTWYAPYLPSELFASERTEEAGKEIGSIHSPCSAASLPHRLK